MTRSITGDQFSPAIIGHRQIKQEHENDADSENSDQEDCFPRKRPRV